MRVRVKFCGIRDLSEAEFALEAGADLVGLNFISESARRIDLRTAKMLSKRLEGHVERVALFSNATESQISEVLEAVPLERVQFHGKETPEFVAGFDIPTIKAIAGANPGEAARYSDSLILLDHPSGKAGKGKVWDWSAATSLLQQDFTVILAGGLDAENVVEALRSFRDHLPWGVDVASGVEVGGRKDLNKMKAFVESVRRFDGSSKFSYEE